MAVMRITDAEILDAIAEATRGEGPEEAQTVPEMARATGVTRDRVRDALALFKVQGRLGIHKVRREALDGRNALVVAYTVAPTRAKHKKG